MARPRRYMDLPRNKRRDRFVAVRWRIASDSQGRGVFACRHLLPGTRGWQDLGLDDDARQTHADVWFLSRKHAREGVWYSASLATVDQAVCVWLEEAIEGALQASAGGEILEYRAAHWRERGRMWEAVTPDQWKQAPIMEGCTLDFSYPHAVRVLAVVDHDNLDPGAIASFVHDFIGRGETPWQHPVDWDRHHDAISLAVEQQVELYSRLARADDQRSEGSIQ